MHIETRNLFLACFEQKQDEKMRAGYTYSVPDVKLLIDRVLSY